jgi:predicted nucleic acid-binding protein
MRVWVDSSTLIALEAIGEVLVLRDLVARITITPLIADEVFTGRESQALKEARGSWIEVIPIRGDRKRWTALGLGVGEASLFDTPKGDRLILDELAARTVAEAEGRDYTGLLGLLLAGVEADAIAASGARNILERLARSSFRMGADLYGESLRQLEDRDRDA